MPADLQFFEADGTTPASAPNWGVIRPGQTGAAKTVIVKNVGDAPATNPAISIATAGPLDLEQWITGTSGGSTFNLATPLTQASLTAAATLTLTLNLVVPSGAPLSTTPAVALLYADWDS